MKHPIGKGYRYRHNIEVLTCGPVVYVRNYKCASTFFYNNFLKWGWYEINWADINWDQHIVFGHIMDPVERRHKGVAEYISMMKLDSLFFENKDFQNFLAHVPVLDKHSASYHDTFGEDVQRINWIPLTNDHAANIKNTEKFLIDSAKIFSFGWNFDWAHVGEHTKKEIEHQLKTIWNQSNIPECTSFYLDRDQELFDTVSKRFDPNGLTWKEMTWLGKA